MAGLPVLTRPALIQLPSGGARILSHSGGGQGGSGQGGDGTTPLLVWYHNHIRKDVDIRARDLRLPQTRYGKLHIIDTHTHHHAYPQ